MEKLRRIKNVVSSTNKTEEPVTSYASSKSVKDFAFKDFKKIADKVSITQQEWSDLLHISERTLQRYSKTNGIFSFAVTDRILQIEKVIKKGTALFGTTDVFMEWIRSTPQSFEGSISLQSLSGIDGIQKVIAELGRIEHGIFA